jgi:predicted lipoprotein with Yx(FWY)xxD motif
MRLAVILFAAVAVSAAAPALAQDAKLGPNGLVDSIGLPLYTYAGDTVPGQSACTGRCAAVWHPYKVKGEAKSSDWSVVVRDDGTKQWAYRGKPLYFYAKDQPGASPTGLSAKWRAAG